MYICITQECFKTVVHAHCIVTATTYICWPIDLLSQKKINRARTANEELSCNILIELNTSKPRKADLIRLWHSCRRNYKGIKKCSRYCCIRSTHQASVFNEEFIKTCFTLLKIIKTYDVSIYLPKL